MSNSRVRCDVAGLVARIQQVGERCVKGISTVMVNGAEVIVHEAKLNAPRDTGALENSIHVERMTNGINGRIWMKITLGSDVREYAYLMEAHLAPHGDGGYKAREGTLSKGPQAGGKFLERALEHRREEIIDKANAIVRRIAQRGL